MKNAVIYARFSSHGQNEMSIEGQIRVCKELAERHGLKIIHTYIEKAKSASKDTHKRKSFQDMLKDVESGAFQHILVYKFDRFVRNRLESMKLKHKLKEEHGVRVLSALEPISDDEGGELYEMFVEWNDEKYSKRLSKNVLNGITTAVDNGTYTGARLILGYKLIDTDRVGKKGTIHKVAIDEEQAPIIRYIFEQYAKGTDKKEIADALNADGKQYNGKPFKYRSFDKWLNNPKYTGEFMLGDRPCNNMFPQIIDKLLFAQVQKRLEKNKILAGANSAVTPYLLTGKVYCGHCDTAMTADGGTGRHGKKHYYYACKKKKKDLCEKKRNKKDDLEEYVVLCVKNFLSDPKNADISATDTINFYEERTNNDGLRSIEVRITNARNEVENMANAFILAKSDLLRASIETKMTDLETLLDDLQMQKSQLELERGFKITKKQILDFIADILQGNEKDKEYQRKVIDNLVKKVYISDGNKFVYLNLSGGRINECDQPITLDETNGALVSVLGVQSLSPMLHHHQKAPNTLSDRVLGAFAFLYFYI